MTCQICKSDCADSLLSAVQFGLHLKEGFKESVCIPCNVRVDFNDATGDTVLFKDDEERSFQVEVCKEHDRTLICGDVWEKFISENELIGGEYIGFYLNGAVPRLRTMYISGGRVEDDPFDSAYFSQRMKKLFKDETSNLFKFLPPTEDYMGVPFVHHLTKTNIVTHKMKSPAKVISGLNIPGVGLAGVRLEAAGPITTVRYRTDKDGRISFNEAGWEEFLKGKRSLRVGTPVLITIRNNGRNDLQMMVVFDLIWK